MRRPIRKGARAHSGESAAGASEPQPAGAPHQPDDSPPLPPPTQTRNPLGAPIRPATWRQPWTLGFVLVAGFVLVLMVLIFRPMIRPLLWAAALATLVYPAHRRLLEESGGRANVAAVLSTLLWLAVIIVPSVIAVNQLVSEVRDLWPRLSAQVGPEVFARAATWAEASPMGRGLHFILQVPEDQGATGLETRLATAVQDVGSTLLNGVRDLTLGAPTALFRVCITVVIFFFFLRQGPQWARKLRDALPLEREHADDLINTVANTIGAVFRGVLLTAAAQAVLATAGYLVSGAPVPILLGFLTLVCSLLPFVGAAAVWVPTAIGLLLTGRTAAGIGLAVWGTLVVSLADNFLRPILIGRNIQIPILWLFLAILGGLQSFGLLGLLLGPATLALFLACYRISQQERARRPRSRRNSA